MTPEVSPGGRSWAGSWPLPSPSGPRLQSTRCGLCPAARRSSTRSQLDGAEAQLKGARARVEQIRINMQDMVVRAPFDGTIATKNTEVGEVISSVMMGQVGGTLPAGAICTLVDLKTLEVVADVNEGSISQVHEGQPAEVTVDAFPGQKWRGVLRQIIPTADRAKAIVQVKVKIINPDERLLPEMSASASFLQSERKIGRAHV